MLYIDSVYWTVKNLKEDFSGTQVHFSEKTDQRRAF